MNVLLLRSEADLHKAPPGDSSLVWLAASPIPDSLGDRALAIPPDPPQLEGWAWIRAWADEHVAGSAIRRLLEYEGLSLWWFADYWMVYGEGLPNFDELYRVTRRLTTALEGRPVTGLNLLSNDSLDDLVASAVARQRGIAYRWAVSPVRRLTARAQIGKRAIALSRLRLAKLLLRGFLARRGRRGVVGGRGGVDVLFNTSSGSWNPRTHRERLLQPLLDRATESGRRVAGIHMDFRRNLGLDSLAHLGPAVGAWEALVTPRLVGKAWIEARRIRRRWKDGAPGNLFGVPAGRLLAHRVEALLRARLGDAIIALETAGRAIERLQPRCVFVTDEYDMWGRSLVVQGRRAGCRVVAVQHGIIDRNHFGYWHRDGEVGPNGQLGSVFVPLADVTAVFGPAAAASLQEFGRYPPDRVRVTGSLLLEQARARACHRSEVRAQLGMADEDVVVTFFGQPASIFPTDDQHLRAVLLASRAFPTLKLILRPHPGDPSSAARYRSSLRALKADAPVILDMDPWDLVIASEALICYNSTTVLDGIALDRPVIHINLSSVPDLFPFVSEGGALGIYREEDLGPTLELVMSPARRDSQVGRQRPYGGKVFSPNPSPSRAILELGFPGDSP